MMPSALPDSPAELEATAERSKQVADLVASLQDPPDLSGMPIVLTDPVAELLIEPKDSTSTPPSLYSLMQNALPPMQSPLLVEGVFVR